MIPGRIRKTLTAEALPAKRRAGAEDAEKTGYRDQVTGFR
jgi:hypothetical protein